MVIYTGPSHLDPSRSIVVILTEGSSNVKTGPMSQLWILGADANPQELLSTKQDGVVCGDCKYSGGNGCYVNVAQAPLGIWKKWKRGGYETCPSLKAAFVGKTVRLGAYGDPAAIPPFFWEALSSLAHTFKWTGYTHQWKRAPWLRSWCMASVDSVEEYALAKSLGWRTFRVALDHEELRTETTCVNTTHGTTCEDCLMCNGNWHRSGSDVVISAHGPAYKMLRLRVLLKEKTHAIDPT